MKKLIYLASPYTHKDHNIKIKRYRQVCHAALILHSWDIPIYSPIAHWHPIAELANKTPGITLMYNRLLEHDGIMISRCDDFWVLDLEGFDNSTGIAWELAHAAECSLIPEWLDHESLFKKGVSPKNCLRSKP